MPLLNNQFTQPIGNIQPNPQLPLQQGPQMPVQQSHMLPSLGAPVTGIQPPPAQIPQQSLLNHPLGMPVTGLNPQGGQPPPPAQTPQQPMQPQQGLEQGALNGGGVSNKQQISNFMNALNQSNSTTNNSFMNTPQQQQAPVANLVNPNLPFQNQNQPAVPVPIPSQTATMVNMNGMNANHPAMSGSSGGAVLPQQQSIPRPTPQMAMMSDETMKTNVQPADDKLFDFMNNIGAHNYEYKNPELDGKGTFTSPMAQELEKTELGKQAVIDTPRGKMVDYARLGGVNLAAVSVVHREQERMKRDLENLRNQIRIIKGK